MNPGFETDFQAISHDLIPLGVRWWYVVRVLNCLLSLRGKNLQVEEFQGVDISRTVFPFPNSSYFVLSQHIAYHRQQKRVPRRVLSVNYIDQGAKYPKSRLHHF